MRFNLEGRHNGRRLFTPFASSPAILSLFLIAIVVCIALLEVVITISGQTETKSKHDISTRDVQAKIEHVTAIWIPAIIKRQDDTSDSGDGSDSNGDTTSSDTGTDTSTSTTDNTSTSNGDGTSTGTTDDSTAGTESDSTADTADDNTAATGDDTTTTADDTDSAGDETTNSTEDDTAADDTSSATDDITSTDTDDTSTDNEDDANSSTGDDTSDDTQDDNSDSTTDDADDTTGDDSETADGDGDDDEETGSGNTDEDNTDEGDGDSQDNEETVGSDNNGNTEDDITDGSDDGTGNDENSASTNSKDPSSSEQPGADNPKSDESTDSTNSNSATDDNSANSDGVDEGVSGNNDSDNGNTSGTTSSDPNSNAQASDATDTSTQDSGSDSGNDSTDAASNLQPTSSSNSDGDTSTSTTDDGNANINGSSGSASMSANPLVPSVGPAAIFAKSSVFQDQGRPLPLPSGVKAMPAEVTSSVYFTATFLLIIIAVCFKTLWLVIFANIKLNEPFYHLALPGGADPTTGLFFEFLATGFPIDHFKAGLTGNWTSWYMITSYATLMILLLLPSVASEAFSIQNVKGTCRTYDTSDLTCAKRAWTVSTGPVRTLQLLLALLAVAVLTVMVMQLRRKHTLSVKTTDLEAIRHVLKDHETLAVIRRVTPESTASESYAALTQYRYRLESHNSSHEIENDVLRCSPEQHPPEISHTLDFLQHILAPLAKIQSTLDLVVPGFLILLLMTFITYYVDVPAKNSNLTSFLQNNRFGAKFILSNITLLLGISFCRVEYEVRILTTYRSLYLAKNPQAILSRSLHGSPFTQTWSAIKHGQWVCALVSGMAGVGVQLLSITIVNVPWHSGNSIQNTSMCILISMILLSLMAGSLAAVAVWRRSLPIGIPRVPATLADIAVLMVHDRVPGVTLGREEKEILLNTK